MIGIVDLLALRYFQVVARFEHISRAAAELRVAQPSLSRTIARLEAELGVPLFDRQGRHIRLNRFGAAYLRRVDRALAELDDARTELADAAGLARGIVAVASETLLSLTDLVADFRARHPAVSIQLHQSTAERMAQQLAAREVDLCLASQPIAGPALRAVELVREEVLLVVPPAHPLAARRRVAIEELADEPVVTTRPGYWQRALTDRLFAAAGRTPNVVVEGDELAAVQPLVHAGLGVGLIPEMSRRAGGHPAVGWLRVDDPGCQRTLRLVWREDAYSSGAAARFRDLVIARYRDPAPRTAP
ncbi:LysR substrate-binding domain-containing protein [Nocardia sp. CDC159]|uniref:LysR substrate-binding domain-containing protein n=1 Tax=Nocardia pulmonis TaxID=2951408 RepID=A0A9X2E821_9NOCA|nr:MULTISPECIES: LysR substrate-binding domain-containing protein [Nocardia]MCM6774585.1 LysR substrate-binding domain-containing protein [Nocardia pulmonis]MCM6787350.1 LysR substrate-binding domain-containing protein [Nocardia sp. CDC159]